MYLIPQNQQLTTVTPVASSLLSSKLNKFSAASHFSTTPARTMSGMVDHGTMWKAERVRKQGTVRFRLLGAITELGATKMVGFGYAV